MRVPRVKVQGEEAFYHCTSRSVNGERLFDHRSREFLRRQIWQVAEYCGVLVLTYAILANHFHVLVCVPAPVPISDQELLRRYRVMYPRTTRYQVMRIEVIARHLAANTSEGQAWRKRQLRLMGDVSVFMQLVKQRFSIWFNQTHRRFGTLWAERFKSVLIEPRGTAAEAVATYIDLNAVRAGLVSDPKDYRFCGYAEAVAGHLPARRGLASVFSSSDWSKVQALYRIRLFGVGSVPRRDKWAMGPEQMQKVLASEGMLSLSELLRCRIRYFSDGAVLGSQEFVTRQMDAFLRRTGIPIRSGPHALPCREILGALNCMRKLRGLTIC